MDNNKGKFEILELFMAQAGKDRRFYGTINRGFTKDGTRVLRGKIMMQDGFILAQAGTQEELGDRLDELVLMVLDEGLHSNDGATFTTCKFIFFSN